VLLVTHLHLFHRLLQLDLYRFKLVGTLLALLLPLATSLLYLGK
jgi:hypothetical protein